MEDATFDPALEILSRAFVLDVHTLNYVAEIALGDREEGEFTSAALADIYVRKVVKILNLNIAPESCERAVGHMELNFRTASFQGKQSDIVRGYMCIGTTFVKKITHGSKVVFSFKWHPRLNELLSY